MSAVTPYIRMNHEAALVRIDRAEDGTWAIYTAPDQDIDDTVQHWETDGRVFDSVNAAIGAYIGDMFAAPIEGALICEEVELLEEWRDGLTRAGVPTN